MKNKHIPQNSDELFEGLLKTTIAEMPTTDPPVNFMESVMEALPEQAPVVLPDPALELAPPSPWKWIAAPVAATGIAAMAAWHWSQDLILWIYSFRAEQLARVGEGSFDLTLFLEETKASLASSDMPLMTIAMLALLAVTAWGATSMASGNQSVEA